MVRPVKISISLVPNLLQYILVGLGAGRFEEMVNPAYTSEKNGWIRQDIKDNFSHKFREITGVSSSTWFALLYQIPAYLADDTLDSLLDVLELLKNEPPLSVIRDFPDKAKLIEEYIPPESFHQYVGFSGRTPSFWVDVITDFAEAVKSGYEEGFEEKWSSIYDQLEKIGDTLKEDYFDDFDWIAWWEDRTGIRFPYPCFNVELVDITITQGTSLLAERDGFYAHAHPLKIATMVSHEICTHLLYNRQAIQNPIVGPLIEEDLERYLRTVEVMSWATNRELIDQQGYEWTMEESFDWIGESRDAVADLLDQTSQYWRLMEQGFRMMKS